MRLIPAIDLRDGRCVRLYKGDFDQETRYAIDPVVLRGQYRELGAEWLHVVDLDGAEDGLAGEPAVDRANAYGRRCRRAVRGAAFAAPRASIRHWEWSRAR